MKNKGLIIKYYNIPFSFPKINNILHQFNIISLVL